MFFCYSVFEKNICSSVILSLKKYMFFCYSVLEKSICSSVLKIVC